MRRGAPRPHLDTDRLHLRPFTLDDAPRVAELAGAEEVAATTLTIPHPYALSDATEWIETHQPAFETGTQVVFALTLRDTGEVVGAMGLTIDAENERAELGYWVGVPFWGRGYATEAARAVVGYGLGELALHRIHAHYFTENPASGRVMQKIGMSYEGRMPGHIKKNGVFRDVDSYGVLRENWREPSES